MPKPWSTPWENVILLNFVLKTYLMDEEFKAQQKLNFFLKQKLGKNPKFDF